MSELLVVVDLGSNAVRFALARVTPGRGFRLLRESRAQTRLAAGRGRRLPERGVRATVDATRRFLRDADVGRPLRVLAVATAAVRDADNARRLAEGIRRVAGVDIEVLGWEEEARLGAVAVMASLPGRDVLVVDLGGGSLQVTRVRDGTITPLASLPLGAVRATRRYFRHDPPAPGEIRALRRHVRDALGVIAPDLTRETILVGLGGTARALGRMHLCARSRRRGLHGLRLDRETVGALCTRVQAMPIRRRERLEGLPRKRADVIVAGAIVLHEVMSMTGLPALTVCERGVRHGLLLRETFGLERGA
jgi:exopolyphosphatase/guanosine-5'-triphosphate,3'-diphosphate pyrophosphatase